MVTGSSSYSVTEALSQAFVADARSPPHTATESSGYISTQPLLKEDQELGELTYLPFFKFPLLCLFLSFFSAQTRNVYR